MSEPIDYDSDAACFEVVYLRTAHYDVICRAHMETAGGCLSCLDLHTRVEEALRKARQGDGAAKSLRIERDAALSLAATRLARIEALTTDLEREKAGTDALRKRIEGADKEIEAKRESFTRSSPNEWAGGVFYGLEWGLNALRREK